MKKLPRNSKQWWSLTNQLLRRNCASHFSPPLRNDRGDWFKEPKEKADTVAQNFSGKFQLPPETHEVPFFYVPAGMTETNIIRRRHVRRELKKLRTNQATEPDGIPAIMLKILAEFLDLSIAILCRRIFREAT